MQQTQVASDVQHADYRRKHLAAEAELQQEVAVLTQAKAVLSERLSELNALTGKQSVDLLQVGWVGAEGGDWEVLWWVAGVWACAERCSPAAAGGCSDAGQG